MTAMTGGPRMRRAWQQCSDERGMALVMALCIMAILLVTGTFMMTMSATEGDIAYSSMWGEGSFFAADAAINVGLDQGVAPTNQTSSAVAQTTIGGTFTYQGNVTFTGTGPAPGYSLRSGTGDNPGGDGLDRKSTRLNSSHRQISYALLCF